MTAERVCVTLSNMKVATVRQVQHHLAEVLAQVERGEEVRVTRRGTTIARIVPPEAALPKAWPDFVARARAVWGTKPRGPKLSDLVDEDRGPR